MVSEIDRIRQLRSLFGAPPPGVTLGIGDDAAVIESPKAGQLVWTIDACVENIHFRPNLISWHEVGYKSFMAAASDIAAMAAHPIGALSSLALPKDLSDDAVWDLANGQKNAADKLNSAVIGGNLSASDTVSITTTVLGTSARTPRRDGARVGDLVALCGKVGLAAAGLRLLLRNPKHIPSTNEETEAIAAWRMPLARIADGLRCHNASSLIDVSDGLSRDAHHIAEASGVRIDIDSSTVLSNALQTVAMSLGVDALGLALCGGEDYALLGTFADGKVPAGFVVIGMCCCGDGVWVDGKKLADDCGFDHFRVPEA
ncbi:MAG: thiamine-phosphate kinase [Polyangiaceae bacterium]|nr:thiamine-phosphate kinase [Polyangiaceae bacterium]